MHVTVCPFKSSVLLPPRRRSLCLLIVTNRANLDLSVRVFVYLHNLDRVPWIFFLLSFFACFLISLWLACGGAAVGRCSHAPLLERSVSSGGRFICRIHDSERIKKRQRGKKYPCSPRRISLVFFFLATVSIQGGRKEAETKHTAVWSCMAGGNELSQDALGPPHVLYVLRRVSLLLGRCCSNTRACLRDLRDSQGDLRRALSFSVYVVVVPLQRLDSFCISININV